jgi:hypothetical protein
LGNRDTAKLLKLTQASGLPLPEKFTLSRLRLKAPDTSLRVRILEGINRHGKAPAESVPSSFNVKLKLFTLQHALFHSSFITMIVFQAVR